MSTIKWSYVTVPPSWRSADGRWRLRRHGVNSGWHGTRTHWTVERWNGEAWEVGYGRTETLVQAKALVSEMLHKAE